MFLRLGFAVSALGAIAAGSVHGQSPHAQPLVSLTWRLVENTPELRFRCELTIHNQTTKPLPNQWELYFNSASRLFPDSVTSGFALEHINGDFWALKPDAKSERVSPGARRTVRYEGGPWAIARTDAPSGFYLVVHGDAAQRPIPLPLSIAPFPKAERLIRGKDDAVPIATAESRYHENESLRLLPSAELTKVVPTPIQLQPLSGQVRLNRSTVVAVDEEQLADTAELLVDFLQPLLDSRLEIRRSAAEDANTIRLRTAEVEVGGKPRQEGEEAYILTASPDGGVQIVGSDPAAVFYGVQTLRALLPIDAYRAARSELTVDAVRIRDAPRFSYRGLHLDVARNFQSKETVEQLLDLMAFYKLNRFHFHLTDDEGWRIQIRALPKLTDVGGRRGHTLDEADFLVPSHGSGPYPDDADSAGSGFYTQDDLIEILQYAHARHIVVIPEIDMPGHSRAAIKAMEARCRHLMENGVPTADQFLLREPDDPSEYESVQMWNDNVVDVGREATYRFLAVVVSELSDVYRRAGVPLTTIHLGGDEVPDGAWEKSAACQRIPLVAGSKIPRRGQLEIYFLKRASRILATHSVRTACWEDCLLLEFDEKSSAGNDWRAGELPAPIAFVWNNVWGWGREDAAYHLANAGIDVVLCHATNLYFDLACEKHPSESGYYWAGFVDARAPFELVPFDVVKNADKNRMGQTLSLEQLAGHARLTPVGEQHILGIQGQLWGENLRSSRDLQYMAFQRVICLAERAWAKSPHWAQLEDAAERRRELAHDWNQFANRLGQRELPRLDYLHGGVQYRLPPPGAVIRDRHVHANVEFPGLSVRYSTSGTKPTASDPVYSKPLPATGTIRMRVFDSRGRGGRALSVAPSAPANEYPATESTF